MVYCSGVDLCKMKETMICFPKETCKSSYNDSEVNQNRTNSSSEDTKVSRKSF